MRATPVLRDRLLAARWLVGLLVTWGSLVVSVPRLAETAPLPPARAPGAAGDLEAIRAALEHRLVRERLAALGVSDADAARVLERLTPEERAEVAARAHELEAGGHSTVAAVLAVAIIVAMLVILVLELLGRRVISRP